MGGGGGAPPTSVHNTLRGGLGRGGRPSPASFLPPAVSPANAVSAPPAVARAKRALASAASIYRVIFCATLRCATHRKGSASISYGRGAVIAVAGPVIVCGAGAPQGDHRADRCDCEAIRGSGRNPRVADDRADCRSR